MQYFMMIFNKKRVLLEVGTGTGMDGLPILKG